jgi:hypothetical protein
MKGRAYSSWVQGAKKNTKPQEGERVSNVTREAAEVCMMTSCINHTLPQILLGGRREWGTYHTRQVSNAYNSILSENLKEKGHLEYLGIYGRIILKWFLIKWGMRVRTGFV